MCSSSLMMGSVGTHELSSHHVLDLEIIGAMRAVFCENSFFQKSVGSASLSFLINAWPRLPKSWARCLSVRIDPSSFCGANIIVLRHANYSIGLRERKVGRS